MCHALSHALSLGLLHHQKVHQAYCSPLLLSSTLIGSLSQSGSIYKLHTELVDRVFGGLKALRVFISTSKGEQELGGQPALAQAFQTACDSKLLLFSHSQVKELDTMVQATKVGGSRSIDMAEEPVAPCPG